MCEYQSDGKQFCNSYYSYTNIGLSSITERPMPSQERCWAFQSTRRGVHCTLAVYQRSLHSAVCTMQDAGLCGTKLLLNQPSLEAGDCAIGMTARKALQSTVQNGRRQITNREAEPSLTGTGTCYPTGHNATLLLECHRHRLQTYTTLNTVELSRWIVYLRFNNTHCVQA